MTQTQLPTVPPPQPPMPTLMRRDERKVVAGVCSGLAYRLGVDPNVVRIVTIVLALFGGAGVLLYLLGWLLLPEERTGRSLGERAVRGGGQDGAPAILLAVALTIVAVGFGFAVVGDNWFGVAVLAVAVAIGALLLTRRPDTAPTAPPAAPGSSPATAPSAAVANPAYAAATRPGPARAAPGYSGTPVGGTGYLNEQPAPWPEPPPSRPRSLLGPLTVFAAVASVGLVGLLDAVGAQMPLAAYFAAPLAVVGVGLVVGTWVGRSRGLIALGVALAVVLVPVASIEQLWDGGRPGDVVADVLEAPTSPGQIDGRVVEYPAGDVRWDLSGVDFAGEDVAMAVNVGAGALVVDLPPDVTLVLDATVGAGRIDVLGTSSEGLAVDSRRTFEADEEVGTLSLSVQVGLGTLEVDRAQA